MKMRVRNKAAWSDRRTLRERANLRVAYEAALEGIVLLENDGCLPLKKGKIALYGAGADMTIKGGTGSGEVNERHAVSIMEGLEKAGFKITTKKWIEHYRELFKREEMEYAKEFRKKVFSLNPTEIMGLMTSPFQYPFGRKIVEKDIVESDTDTCIYVVARQAGEGADKRLDKYEYSLSPWEKVNIAFCAERYEKMVLVINSGSSFDMNFLDEIQGINAVVFFCQQGTMGGCAFADLIRGKESPSGKLADTWAMKYEDIPYATEYSYLNGNVDQEYYREGIYVGYRYFDSFQVKPRYEFGYGLSYTTFQSWVEEINVENGIVTIKAAVRNNGEYFGREVLQLYVSCPQSEIKKEYQKLVAFGKTSELQPGKEERLTLSFRLADLASYDETAAVFVLDAGDYIVRMGNSSRNTKIETVLKLEEKVITEKCRPICQRKEVVDEIAAPEIAAAVIPERTPVFVVKAEEIEKTEHEYRVPKVYSSEETDAILRKLSIEEMAALTVGTGLATGNYFHAPGSAGATTGKLLKKGIPNVCLADGPAGLRLQRRSAVTKDGKIKAIDPFLSLINYMPDFAKKLVLADPEKNPVIYQFTTAFPVGLALAQTWNTKLVEKVGEAVGEEMKEYGVTYWLAPAMNIHRNPLCGRNFEYYSEDPFLSGAFAAAMTKGVQQNRGCYVTLKHFCCNNQEDNRNKTNANVNERALREIYLQGFRYAIRDGKPGAIMTSYNKVNGTYVNNSYDLVTKVLRNEWGFDGLVMTDWFATGKGVGSHALAISAGNDLIMPGGNTAEREIVKAAESGLIQTQDVKRCAANVLKGILSSRIYQAYKNEKKQL